MRLYEIIRPKDSEEIIDWMNRRGYHIIKYGNEANIFYKEGDNFVIKVFNNSSKDYIKFLNQINDNPHFPRIIGKPTKINDNDSFIRIEKLSENNILAEKISTYSYLMAYLYYNYGTDNIDDITEMFKRNKSLPIKMINLINQDFNKNIKPVFDIMSFLKFIRTNPEYFAALKIIFNNRHFDQMDLEPRNIMFRDNVPVIIDPVIP